MFIKFRWNTMPWGVSPVTKLGKSFEDFCSDDMLASPLGKRIIQIEIAIENPAVRKDVICSLRFCTDFDRYHPIPLRRGSDAAIVVRAAVPQPSWEAPAGRPPRSDRLFLIRNHFSKGERLRIDRLQANPDCRKQSSASTADSFEQTLTSNHTSAMNMMKFLNGLHRFAACVGLLAFSSVALSGSLIVYTFTEEGVASLNATHDSVATYSGSAMSFDAGLFGATGFSTQSNSAGAYEDASGSHHWFSSSMNASLSVDATTPYLQFNFTPETGEVVEVQRFAFGARVLASSDQVEKDTLNTGWPGPVQFELRSSIDNFTTPVAAGAFPDDKDATWYLYDQTFPAITTAVDESLTLRLYLLDAGAGSRGGSFRIDDVTISTIPEPSTYALLGSVAALLFVMLRRRRS